MEPDVGPNRPAGQSTHVLVTTSPYRPAAQDGTGVEVFDPGGHTYPGAHGPLHAGLVSPTLSPYTPAGHSRHTPDPIVPYRPMGHSCAVEDVDPAGHAYPAVQLPLQVGDVWPPVAP